MASLKETIKKIGDIPLTRDQYFILNFLGISILLACPVILALIEVTR